MNNYKIISLGGSIIIPPEGFDINFLKKFKKLIIDQIKKGQKFVLVVGGGSTCRQYQQAIKKVIKTTDKDLDWLGIYTTWYNAEFVRMMFGKLAYSEVVKDPTKKIKTSKKIIIAGGWKPGASTDYDAVLLAQNLKAKELINMSNIDYVYTADPKKNKKAIALPTLTWSELKKIVGTKWIPGANVPFDPKAVNLAKKLNLTVKFIKGSNLSQVKIALDGKKIYGTVVQ
jgi:uridylate kinase